MKMAKGKKTGGRKKKTVQYNPPNTTDYANGWRPQVLPFNDGTNSPVLQWGSCYFYNATSSGTGGRYRFNEFKAANKRKCFRFWGSSSYDQISRLVQQYDKAYIRGRKITVESLGAFVRLYRGKNWTDPIKFLAACARSGQEVHIVLDKMTGTELEELVNAI